MKKHVQKAIKNIDEKKQGTFETIENVPKEIRKKKKGLGKPIATYWVCVNGHVFEYKYRIHPTMVEKMKCPICSGRIQNKTTRSTYLYYLNKKGRGDVKRYKKLYPKG